MARARSAYQYDYETVASVAMLRRIPRREVPSFRWMRIVLRVVGGVLLNDVRAASSFARRRHGIFGPVREIARWVISRVASALRALRVAVLRAVARRLRLEHEDVLNLKISPDVPDRSETRGRLLNAVVLDEPTGSTTDIGDFERLFSSIEVPALASSWSEDRVFARLRVAGPNPMAIERATPGWHAQFPVNADMFRSVPGFEDDDLAAAEAQDRLYLVDYRRLVAVQPGDNDGRQKFSYAPKALFAVPVDRRHGDLLPIAIQCQQQPDPEAMFTPDDGVAWEMAKTVVNIADTNQHGFVAHLAHTHLMVEPFVLATPRQLSDRHPLYALLMPHLEATAFINFVATELLLAPVGSVDELFSGTLEASAKVAITATKDAFNELMLPHDLAARGVESPKLDFPYRQDATALWDAIGEWVEDYLAVYYRSDDDVAGDVELAAWARELVSDDGGRIRGFGEDGAGAITTREYLFRACTMLIFTASAQHAAVNSPQRSVMAYAPILPMGGYAPPPRASETYVEADHLRLFPPLETARKQVRELCALGGVLYKQLGEYEDGHFADERVHAALGRFRARLERIEATIERRANADAAAGRVPYLTLLPSAIPMSISI